MSRVIHNKNYFRKKNFYHNKSIIPFFSFIFLNFIKKKYKIYRFYNKKSLNFISLFFFKWTTRGHGTFTSEDESEDDADASPSQGVTLVEKISKLVVEEVTSISKSEFKDTDNIEKNKNLFNSSAFERTVSITENKVSNDFTYHPKLSIESVPLNTVNINSSSRNELSGGFGNYRRGKPVFY